MSVKTIFKTIIGTMVLMALISIVLEYFNVSTTSLQLQGMTKMSVRQACVFFGQETYKRNDAGVSNVDDLYGVDGAQISGTFYTGGTTKGIYDSLYKYNTKFKGWAQTYSGNWSTLKSLVNGLNGTGSGTEGDISKFYVESMMTPLNVGVPYLDREVVQRIAIWNLTSILNNGQYRGDDGKAITADEIHSGLIIDRPLMNLYGSGTDSYVLYKGFKVFVNQLTVKDIEYRIVDLTTSSGKADFKKYTNMDASVVTDKTEGSSDERNKVCLAGISYSVPMQYAGITPIKKVMEYTWNRQVAGANDKDTRYDQGNVWNDQAQTNMNSGGFGGTTSDSGLDTGVLPVPGDLIYYIIR